MNPVALAVLVTVLSVVHPAVRSSVAADAPPEGFVSYRARGGQFTPVSGLRLRDAFGQGRYNVKAPRDLLVAVDGGDGGALQAYALELAPGGGAGQTGVVVSNAFGTLSLDTKRAKLLLVPTLVGTAGAPVGENAYTCYRAKVTKNTPRFLETDVTVGDALGGLGQKLRVRRPRQLCLPSDRNGLGITDPTTLLTCYQAKQAGRGPTGLRRIVVGDQFGQRRLKPKRTRRATFCLVSSIGLRLGTAQAKSPTLVVATFSKRVGAAAGLATSYAISPPLAIKSAQLDASGTAVALVTEPQQSGAEYTLSVGPVVDENGNGIAPGANQATFTGFIVGDDTLPRVVGAISTSSTKVVVQFSRPMGDSAVLAQNYEIVQQNVDLGDLNDGLNVLPTNPDGGRLTVVSVRFANDDHTTVELTTLAQSEIRYLLTASGMSDAIGQPLPPSAVAGTTIINPSQTSFRGTGESGPPTDSDGDGLPDAVEQRGWIVTVKPANPNGKPTLRHVTSDPLRADTDGDQLKDGDEILVSSRNPRIADLPQLGMEVGEMSLALDVAYRFRDEKKQEQTVSDQVRTVLKQDRGTKQTSGREKTFESSFELGLEVEQEIKLSPLDLGGTKITASTKTSQSRGTTTKWDQETSNQTSQENEKIQKSDRVVGATSSVEHEVTAGALDVSVTLKNLGTTAFSVANMQISALQLDPIDRGRLLPVATLKPKGGDITVNLGPLGGVSQRGPIVFSASSASDSAPVFKSQIEDLVKYPRGLVFQ